MTRDELLRLLLSLHLKNSDPITWDREQSHMDADIALLEYINDVEITAAFGALEKWYA